ncbi:hypothetical protein EV191_10797 [Tamaricihabitans halophyticus]|uniref:DUF5808 domain-containing protein n=2 Tax=Tamaricihabitans halophyticus TaxID=1262583 RepID=A0A4R2QMN6_9PSEU|nr:hypothetical protein EV191_10797 [Tamaricihabitans halophyticus]
MDKVRRIVGFTGAALLGAAIVTEIGKEPADRTWEGTIAGLVPYDLRRPTLERVRERCWNPTEPRILAPHVFGVGWSVNFGYLARKLRLTRD